MREGADNLVILRFKSLGENVSLARLVVAALVSKYDMTIVELDEIRVAVSEAVSNAIIHGYLNREDEMVELTGERKGNQLIVTIRDEGIGIEDIPKAMEASYSREDGRMGLGFTFMQSFMDEVEVISAPNAGTTVILSKELKAPPIQDEGDEENKG